MRRSAPATRRGGLKGGGGAFDVHSGALEVLKREIALELTASA